MVVDVKAIVAKAKGDTKSMSSLPPSCHATTFLQPTTLHLQAASGGGLGVGIAINLSSLSTISAYC